MKVQPSGLVTRFASFSVFVLLAAACGSTTTTTAPATGTPHETAVASAPPTAPTTVSPTTTSTAALSATPEPTTSGATAPTGTGAPLTRGPWVHGQNISDYVLVASEQGWVWTNRGIYQTIDDGATWANVTPGLGTSHALIMSKVRALGATDATHALLVVADAGRTSTTVYVWRTADGGASWSYMALPAFRQVGDATACGHDAQCVGSPGDPMVKIDSVSASVAYLTMNFRIGPGESTGMMSMQYRTTDGGRTWTRLHFTATDDFYLVDAMPNIYFASATSGVVVAGGDVYSTHSGWGSWTHQTITTYTGDDFWPDMSPGLVDSTHWYVSGDITATGTLTYAFSSNQGGTWERRTCTIGGVSDATSVHVWFMDQINWVATVVTVSGTTTTVHTYMTGTGGANWSSMGTLPSTATSASWVNTVRGWAMPTNEATTRHLYSTLDHGLHWHTITE